MNGTNRTWGNWIDLYCVIDRMQSSWTYEMLSIYSGIMIIKWDRNYIDRRELEELSTQKISIRDWIRCSRPTSLANGSIESAVSTTEPEGLRKFYLNCGILWQIVTGPYLLMKCLLVHDPTALLISNTNQSEKPRDRFTLAVPFEIRSHHGMYGTSWADKPIEQ